MILRQSYRHELASADASPSAYGPPGAVQEIPANYGAEPRTAGGNRQSSQTVAEKMAEAPPILLSAVPDCDEYLAQEPQEPGYGITIVSVIGFYVLAYLIYLLCRYIKHEVPLAMDAIGQWIQLLRSGR